MTHIIKIDNNIFQISGGGAVKAKKKRFVFFLLFISWINKSLMSLLKKIIILILMFEKAVHAENYWYGNKKKIYSE